MREKFSLHKLYVQVTQIVCSAYTNYTFKLQIGRSAYTNCTFKLQVTQREKDYFLKIHVIDDVI